MMLCWIRIILFSFRKLFFVFWQSIASTPLGAEPLSFGHPAGLPGFQALILFQPARQPGETSDSAVSASCSGGTARFLLLGLAVWPSSARRVHRHNIVDALSGFRRAHTPSRFPTCLFEKR